MASYIKASLEGKKYKVPLPQGLKGADPKVLSFYTEHAIRSAGGQGTPIEDGVILITNIPLATRKFITSNGTINVQLPQTASVGDVAKSKEALALAGLLAPGQYDASQNALAQQQAAKDMSAFEAFGRSAGGEAAQLWTGLKQQGNRFLGDQTRFAELQKESDKRQEGLDAISGENPVSSFAGSVAPYFAPLGLGPIMRGVGLAGKIPSALSNIASKFDKGTLPRKAAGYGSELFKSPLALAGMVGAAEGTIHPQQGAISGALFGTAGNTVGRHLAKWTPFEKVSGGAPNADQKEIIGFLDKQGGDVQPYMRTGDVSDLSKHHKDRLDPREVDRFQSETLPKNDKAIQRGLLDIIAKGGNSPPAELVSNAEKAITDGRLNKGLIEHLKNNIKLQDGKALTNVAKKHDIWLDSLGKPSSVKAQKDLSEAMIHKVNMENKKNAADILSSSLHAGKINLEELIKKIDDPDLYKVREGAEDEKLFQDMFSQHSNIQKTADHMIQMKKDFTPTGELKRPSVRGGVNDLFRDLEKHGFSGYKLPQGLLGDIGAGLGYSTHDDPVTFGTNKVNSAVDLFKSLQGNPE